MKIDRELKQLMVYQYDVSPRLDALIRHVLNTIPASYRKDFPSSSVFEYPIRLGAKVEDADVGDGKIYCNPSLLDMPGDVAIGILAHEFAHLFLRHPSEGGLRDDWEADALASKWGFTEEIKAMRQHEGAPTDSRH